MSSLFALKLFIDNKHHSPNDAYNQIQKRGLSMSIQLDGPEKAYD